MSCTALRYIFVFAQFVLILHQLQILASAHHLQVFVGSFRGGKRGGSRTAHLKQAAADTASASESDLPATTWRSTRPRAPRSRPAEPAGSSRQFPSADPALDEEEAGEAVETEGDEEVSDEVDDADELIEEEEEETKPSSSHGVIHTEESGELMFEADVVDALPGLASSQPPG